MFPHVRALALSCLVAAACRPSPLVHATSSPPPTEPIVSGGEARPRDDGHLHLHRNYFALEQVGREAQRALEAAREVRDGKPVVTFRALFDAPFESAIPPSYDVPVTLRVMGYGRRATGAGRQSQLSLALALHPRRAIDERPHLRAVLGESG